MCPYARAGKLDDIRREVKGSDDDDDSGSEQDGWYEDDDWGSSSSGGSSVGGALMLEILTWPWSLPHLLIEGDGGSTGYPIGHPYIGGSPGRLTIVRHDASWMLLPYDRPPPGRWIEDHVSVDLTLRYMYDLEAVHQPAVEARLDTSLRLGLQTAWTVLLEPVAGSRMDTLAIGSVDLAFRHVQHEHVEMHTGLGVRLMLDGAEATPGLDVFYSLDVFPARPLVLSARLEAGNLGEAVLVHCRLQGGVTFGGVEVFAGYDAWWIGGVAMHGPTGGVRFWL